MNRLSRLVSVERTPLHIRNALLAAYVLHVVIVALFVFDIIPQEYHRAGYPFWFHQGGDDYGYVDLALNLRGGDLQPNKYPLGFPLLILPFTWILPPNHDALLQPLAIFWGLVMFPLGQVTLFQLARRITRSVTLALGSVFLWTALPLLFYAGLRVISNATVAETASVHLTWAHMLSDGPAALFTLLALLVFLMARERDYPARWLVLLGALGGFLMLIRLTGVLTVGIIGLLLLIERRWLAALIFGVCVGIVFTPQMLYNAHFFGSPFQTGYAVLDNLPPDGLMSLTYLTDALAKLSARLGVLLPVSIVVALGLAGAGGYDLWRRWRLGALAVGLWIISYAAFYSVYYYSWDGALLRFMIPVYPALAILAAGLVGFLVTAIERNRAHHPPAD